MKIAILLLLSFFSINTIYSQCDGTTIKKTYDEFDKTTLNESKITLQNEKGFQFEIELRFIVGQNMNGRTPYITLDARIANVRK